MKRDVLPIEKKTLRIVFFVIVVFALGGSIWLGGKDRWKISGVGSSESGRLSLTAELESEIKEKSDLGTTRYNLAYFYHKQGKFQESRELLLELLNSSNGSSELIKNSFYNLGNDLFRLAEKEETPEGALALLNESLKYYRAVIDKEKQQEKYTTEGSLKDKDTRFNYTVVRQRIKILTDMLEKQRKDQEQQKEVYTLIKELLEAEKEIEKQLVSLQNETDASTKAEIRNELLKQRAENLKKLQLVSQKISSKAGGIKPNKGYPPMKKI